jgi:beta-lactamase superfamily II metal-dependent hydrolase
MSPVFTLDMLPAREGDCLWLTYGDESGKRHVLIDGGRQATGRVVRDRLAALPADERRLELVVVTHVDRDHIEGMLELAEADFHGIEVGDIWFNGYRHLLNDFDPMGAVQGERLTEALSRPGRPWNEAFGRRRVAIEPGQPLALPPLAGGLQLTLLSPTPAKLTAMVKVWEDEVRIAGMKQGLPADEAVPGGFQRMGPIDVDSLAAQAFVDDRAEANGTSIALLAEYAGRRVLLGADAHCDVLAQSVRALGGGARLKLDAFKVAHHGSAHNISRELLDLVDCRRYLLSTNGSYFYHPDAAAVSRVVRFGGESPQLIFNYRSDETEAWEDGRRQQRYGYSALFPPGENGFQTVDLMAD